MGGGGGCRRFPAKQNFFPGIPEKQTSKITILRTKGPKLLVRNKLFFLQNIGSKLFFFCQFFWGPINIKWPLPKSPTIEAAGWGHVLLFGNSHTTRRKDWPVYMHFYHHDNEGKERDSSSFNIAGSTITKIHAFISFTHYYTYDDCNTHILHDVSLTVNTFPHDKPSNSNWELDI